MGTGCSDLRYRNFNNEPDSTKISAEDKDFCTLAGESGDKERRSFCGSIGDSEWKYNGDRGNECHFNSVDRPNRMNSSGECCDGGCAIIGTAGTCERIAYRGSPEMCCFRDNDCSKYNNSSKFDASNSDKRTCDPKYRKLNGYNCRQVSMNVCANADGKHPEWRNYWLTNSPLVDYAGTNNTPVEYSDDIPLCVKVINKNLYGTNPQGCGSSPLPDDAIALANNEGYVWSRQLIQRMVLTYMREGGSLGSSEDSNADNSMNVFLWNLCSKYPGLCQDMVTSACANVTTNDIVKNPSIQKWCGCYMPNSQYSKYTDLYSINKECTPVCNQTNNLPIVEIDGITPRKCKQSTCVIDNVSLSLYSSRVGVDSEASIDFSQICGSCAVDSGIGVCNCSLTGLTLVAAQATIPKISISQSCNGDNTCYSETQTAENLTTTRVPCDGTSNANFLKSNNDALREKASESKFLKSFAILLVFAAIVIVLYNWLYPKWLIEGTFYYTHKPSKPRKVVPHF